MKLNNNEQNYNNINELNNKIKERNDELLIELNEYKDKYNNDIYKKK